MKAELLPSFIRSTGGSTYRFYSHQWVTGWLLFSISFLFFFLTGLRTWGQAAVVTTKTKEVKTSVSGNIVASSATFTMNLTMQPPTNPLPFDVPFQIVGGDDPNATVKLADLRGIDCWYQDKSKVNMATIRTDRGQLDGMLHTAWFNDGTSKQYQLMVENGLKPNRDYVFIFRFNFKKTPDGAIQNKIYTIAKGFLDKQVHFTANGGRFEFSTPALEKLVRTLENQTADALQQQAINVDFGGITPDQLVLLRAPIIDYSDKLDDIKTGQDQLDKRIAFFQRVREAKLKAAETQYAGSTGAVPAVEQALKNALQALPGLYAYLRDNNAVDSVKSKAYLKLYDGFLKKIDPLPASNPALSVLKGELTDGTGEILDDYKRYAAAIAAANKAADDDTKAFIDALAKSLYQIAYFTGSTVPADFKTRANLYVSADLGLAFVPQIAQVTPYLGTNIYLWPVNKSYPLTFHHWDLEKRFSLLVGLSVTTVSKTGYRVDLLGSNFNLITGAGLRVADFVRINGGVLWYSQVNPNPLNSNKNVVCTPFVSLSFDIDIKTVFNNLFTPAQYSSITPP